MAMERSVPESAGHGFTPELLRAEAEMVWRMHTDGLIREACFRTDTHEAILFMEVSDTATARSALDRLPLVRAGLITFDVIPLGPYDGYERLFTKGGE